MGTRDAVHQQHHASTQPNTRPPPTHTSPSTSVWPLLSNDRRVARDTITRTHRRRGFNGTPTILCNHPPAPLHPLFMYLPPAHRSRIQPLLPTARHRHSTSLPLFLLILIPPTHVSCSLLCTSRRSMLESHKRCCRFFNPFFRPTLSARMLLLRACAALRPPLFVVWSRRDELQVMCQCACFARACVWLVVAQVVVRNGRCRLPRGPRVFTGETAGETSERQSAPTTTATGAGRPAERERPTRPTTTHERTQRATPQASNERRGGDRRVGQKRRCVLHDLPSSFAGRVSPFARSRSGLFSSAHPAPALRNASTPIRRDRLSQ